MAEDAGKQMLIEGLKASIDEYDQYKKEDKGKDLHCVPQCTSSVYLIEKTERIDKGQNLMLRWILIQEQGNSKPQDMLSFGKDGIVVNGSRLSFLAGLGYIIGKMNGWF